MILNNVASCNLNMSQFRTMSIHFTQNSTTFIELSNYLENHTSGLPNFQEVVPDPRKKCSRKLLTSESCEEHHILLGIINFV